MMYKREDIGMKKIWYVALFFCILFNLFTFGITAEKAFGQQAAGLKFAVSFTQDAHSEALTGRIYLMLRIIINRNLDFRCGELREYRSGDRMSRA